MSHWTIGKMAKKAGISVRTLRHYDELGLLTPTTRAENGYRFYTEPDSLRLHDILFYRTLGFSLQEIARMLDSTEMDRNQHLLRQRKQLAMHIERLLGIQSQLDATLIKQEVEKMATKQDFSVFEGFDPDRYADEAEQRWGDGDAYKESAIRTSNYSSEDWARIKSESDRMNKMMVELMDQGLTADQPAVLALIEKMRLQIDQRFYPCSRRMHASLGEMYVSDERFAANYEKLGDGMAVFMRDATAANLAREA